MGWVLYNMAFNLGVNGLLQFKNTLSLIKKQQYRPVSKSMLKSKWEKLVLILQVFIVITLWHGSKGLALMYVFILITMFSIYVQYQSNVFR